MSQLEFIKHELHELIDRVDDEAVLARFLGVISSEVEGWQDVTAEERAEIMEAYEESKNPANLVSHEAVKGRFNQWLTR